MHVVLVLYFDYFFSLFLLYELSLFFLHEMLSKCIDNGYLVGATPLTVFHRLFWYNTLIIFSHFFCFVNLVFFFMKCYQSV